MTLPAPLVLRITPELTASVLPDARYVHQQYQDKPSVYETTLDRILMGLLAQRALAWHRGAAEADVREPWRTPYDIAPDIEVRAVRRPMKLDAWAGVALTLCAKDKAKTRRRWVLAMVREDDVVYLGWQTGKALLAHGTMATSQQGRRYRIEGQLPPDELRPMAELS